VEFRLGRDADGKIKAEDVTAPGGGPCSGARRPRTKKKPKDSKTKISSKSIKDTEQFWHDVLEDSVKKTLIQKDINISKGTVDISIDNMRIKLGTHGYASMATSDATLAEGTFSSAPDGRIVFEWARAIRFIDTWNVCPTSNLISELNLTDEKMKAVGLNETKETLMGEVPNPKSTLEASGFQMRRIVLTTSKTR
jgi:hypothetical protein